jgi:cyanobactin biosynthesis protein (PatB/AcyB/McaB family)
MRLPKQTAPVKRPDIIAPHLAVDVIHGRPADPSNDRLSDVAVIQLQLMHGANFNDPPAFQYRSYGHVKTSFWR